MGDRGIWLQTSMSPGFHVSLPTFVYPPRDTVTAFTSLPFGPATCLPLSRPPCFPVSMAQMPRLAMLCLCDCCLASLLPGTPVSLLTCVFATFLFAEPSRMAARDRGMTRLHVSRFPGPHVSLCPCITRGKVASTKHSPEPCTPSGRYPWFPGSPVSLPTCNLSLLETRFALPCRIHRVHRTSTCPPVPPFTCRHVPLYPGATPQARNGAVYLSVALFPCIPVCMLPMARLTPFAYFSLLSTI